MGTHLDTYYRAFLSYRKETELNKSLLAERRIIKKAQAEFDKLDVTKYLCTISDDWIKAIEAGLEFVEKAVAEERQFIRVNGEVVPIEKAKKISKHSVEHLAKHANMITHVPKPGAMLVPDAIYMVEKLNDYTVYENRFLYMLLCYLRDFIGLRISKIHKLRDTYICDFVLKKNHETKTRSFNCDINYHEERFDNPFPIPDPECDALVRRIEDCASIVNMLLNTDLMTEVAKAPMIKPPVVKTNVLKMNNNFKNALALYDYVASYQGDGYEAKEVVRNFAPFNDVVADEMAELVTLTNFLSYKFGNELTDTLKNNYHKYLEEVKAEEEKKLQDQIARLKKKVLESGESMEEYMLLLEKRNKQLEEGANELILAKNKILELEEKIDELKGVIEERERKIRNLEEIIVKKDEEIAYLNKKYIEDMTALKIKHQTEMHELLTEHELELDILNEDMELKLFSLYQNYNDFILDLKEKHRKEIEELTAKYEGMLEAQKLKYEAMLAEQKEKYENMLEVQKEEYEATIKREREMYEKTISDMKENYESEIETMKEEHASTLSEMKARYNKSVEEITDEKESAIQEARDKYEALCETVEEDLSQKYEDVINDHVQEITDLKTDLNMLNERLDVERSETTDSINNLNTEIDDLNQSREILISEYEAKIKELEESYTSQLNEVKEACVLETEGYKKEMEDAISEKEIYKAELDAKRASEGKLVPTTDLASRERFEELEKEFEVFYKFFKKQWSITKKEIRKKILWVKQQADEANEANDNKEA